MDLEYYANMNRRLAKLLDDISPSLTPDDIRAIKLWLDENELGLALEDMRALCNTVPIALTKAQSDEFGDLASMMGLNNRGSS